VRYWPESSAFFNPPGSFFKDVQLGTGRVIPRIPLSECDPTLEAVGAFSVTPDALEKPWLSAEFPPLVSIHRRGSDQKTNLTIQSMGEAEKLWETMNSMGRDILRVVRDTKDEEIHRERDRTSFQVVRRSDPRTILTLFGDVPSRENLLPEEEHPGVPIPPR
jgi:hypothetical protein